MKAVSIERAAALILAAFRERKLLDGLPAELVPRTADEAYAIQRAVNAGMGTPAGYKIGFTNPALQRRYHMPGPVSGRLFRERLLESPARLDPTACLAPLAEPEVAYRLGKDLPPRGAPFSDADVAKAITSVRPSIEVADSRLAGWETRGPLLAIADNVLGSHWVGGPEHEDWTRIDPAALRVVAFLDGNERTSGRGESVMGSPFTALIWLANELARRGEGLSAGDIVTTGCVTEVIPLGRGQLLEADFGPLGAVSLAL